MAYIRKNLFIYASMEFLKERKKRERKKKEHAKYPLHKYKLDVNYYQKEVKLMTNQIEEIKMAMDQLAYRFMTEIEDEDKQDAYLTILSNARVCMMQLETKLKEAK